MAEQIMTSDEARSDWRRVLDATFSGIATIVTRYGEKRAAVISIAEYEEYLRLKGQSDPRQGSTTSH